MSNPGLTNASKQTRVAPCIIKSFSQSIREYNDYFRPFSINF